MRAFKSGTPVAATNDQSAGAICKRRDAVHLGRKEGLQPRERQTARCQLLTKVRPPSSLSLVRRLNAQLAFPREFRVNYRIRICYERVGSREIEGNLGKV